MGWYIETGDKDKGKAKIIAREHDGVIVTQEEAVKLVTSKGVVVVVDNGLFEVAAFAYRMREFWALTLPGDIRPKQFVVLDREVAERLSGWAKAHP